MINLEQKYIDFIKKVISKHLSEYELYLFGSRAKGLAKKYSDIDIAIKSQKLTPQIKSKLGFEFENSTLPYEVDIVDLNNITDEFKNLIQNSMIKL